MGRGSDIPWIRGSNYPGKGVQYTMDREIDIPWGGGKIPWVEGYIYHW